MKPALATIACAAALTLVGCMNGNDGASLAAGDLSRVVLQPDDLVGPWLLFDEGRQARADAPHGARGDPRRFGRIEGWKARYRRSGTAATPGPLVIESRVDLFQSSAGAKSDFVALEEGELIGSGGRSVDGPELGEEALAATLAEGDLRYYLVAWRHDNATASVLINGFEPRTTLSDAVVLARKQQRRLAAVSGR